MRAGWHASRIVGPLAPKRWGHWLFANLRDFVTTLRGKPITHTVRGLCGRCIDEQHRRDGEDLKKGSHEGEVEV